VIDNIAVLGNEESKEVLGPLIEIAKEQADGTLEVTFVDNSPRLITAYRRSSRLGTILEVEDLTDDEAVKYLATHNIGERNAQDIVEIAGGRMNLLQQSIGSLAKNNPISEIRTGLLQQAEGHLRS
jgi:hypothetical protein